MNTSLESTVTAIVYMKRISLLESVYAYSTVRTFGYDVLSSVNIELQI